MVSPTSKLEIPYLNIEETNKKACDTMSCPPTRPNTPKGTVQEDTSPHLESIQAALEVLKPQSPRE